jgi:HAD superfamily hydrolase (TIGR01509 family)
MTGGQVRRGVVFDLDGVIVDSEHLWEESWTAYARQQGREWRREDTLRLQGLSTAEWARAIAEQFGSPGRADEVRSTCVEHYVRRVVEPGEGELLPGSLELLTQVSGRCPIAVASSSPRVGIDAVLARNGISHLFAATVSSEEVPRGKPQPDVYEEAMRRLGIVPGEGIGVEDSANGIRAAHAAGLLVVAIPNPVYRPDEEALALAAFIADDHDSALGFILSHLAEGTPA